MLNGKLLQEFNKLLVIHMNVLAILLEYMKKKKEKKKNRSRVYAFHIIMQCYFLMRHIYIQE